ncbi:T9SS type A sorting domain-containing protein, partial [Salibacteraceae bacterium]|nr:T9SS type A sorting domain-containing protein [Salibacteraceae bacterium]
PAVFGEIICSFCVVKSVEFGSFQTMVVSAGSTIRQVAIYNLLGEQVMNKAVANKSLEQISIDNLSTGVYVVLVKTDIKETALKLYLN